ARALERVPPSAAGALAKAAPVAFASGFADALTVSGVLALVVAVVACKLLAQPMRDAA
ncbi:MFS transporter, partial [Burkholderia sp. HAN2018]|nr:MFS transporter [Burkholderia sp. HAN2018]